MGILSTEYLPSLFVAAPRDVPFSIMFAPISGDPLVESDTIPLIDIPKAIEIQICNIIRYFSICFSIIN